ncbi:hypothetical protein MMC24_001384 [Lignoscripta atroalba]|nr:hypothetical protein [Lignoscripta atroalba]
MPSTTDSTTKSGIITSETGERHIPSSVRSDGSKRKEIKIRPGYKPPEDVEVYRNRTSEAWKTRGSGGVPGAAGIEDDLPNGDAKGSNKNAKRREARKKAKASDEAHGEQPNSFAQANGFPPANSRNLAAGKENVPSPALESELEPEAEKEKQARNLKKKIRQARELREKKDKGESLLPEQFEKVIKINELIRQLDSLGFDAEGEPKKA